MGLDDKHTLLTNIWLKAKLKLYVQKVIFISRAIFGAQEIYYIQNNCNALNFMETEAIFLESQQSKNTKYTEYTMHNFFWDALYINFPWQKMRSSILSLTGVAWKASVNIRIFKKSFDIRVVLKTVAVVEKVNVWQAKPDLF